MPTDSKRQLIVDAIATRFAAIAAADGYTNTLSVAKVWPWRQGEVEPKDMPGIAFADLEEEVQPFSTGGAGGQAKYEATLHVEAEGFVQATGASKTPAEVAELARQLLADMVKAIGDTAGGRTGQSWGLDNVWTTITSTGVQVEPGNRFTGACTLKFDVRYIFSRFDYSA